ncbi:MAG: sulfatase-like hydrolase/transferase [Rikenellaceae bacterium]
MAKINTLGGVLICGIATLAPFTLQAKSAKSTTVERKRPNVIIFNADDLAWGDPSCYGGKLIETPNIDRLAKSGIQCTNGYVSAPVSGVSRVGLLTGSYQQRYGMQWNHDQYKVKGLDNDKPMLPLEQHQMQTAFKEAGYVTAMAGKIGFRDDQPFDEYFSLSFNGVNSFPDERGKYAGADVVPGEKQVLNKNIMWGPERKGDEHITDRTGRQCIEFIEAHKDEPFFFYLAFTAPHTPLHAKKSFKPQVAHIESEVAQAYYAMVLGVDENVGRIMDYLEKNNLRDDTIIIFLSDNGPANPFHLSLQSWWIDGCPHHVLGQRGGLNGFKGNMWEAGIRVPYIVS